MFPLGGSSSTLEGGFSESRSITTETFPLHGAVSLTLDDGEQIVFVEDELDRAIVAERQQRRSAA